MNNLTKQVLEILEKYPETRNSDIALTMQVWKTYYPKVLFITGSNEAILLKDLFVLPREDHIKRIRAVIQNEEHRFLPTDINVLIERAKISKEWRKFLGYDPKHPFTNEEWQTVLQEFDFETITVVKKSRKKAKYPCRTCGMETIRKVEATPKENDKNTMETLIWRECQNGHKEFE